MKKFSKLFLSCAAVAAVTAAVATSAMAADTLTAKYNDPVEGAATTTVDITCASTDATKTLLIISGTDVTSIDTAKVVQIDQGSDIKSAIISASLEEGTYTVLMGGTSGTIYSGTFRIGAGGGLIGDVNLDEDITLADASAIIQYKLKGVALSSEALAVADCNNDADVTLADASAIIQYKLKGVDNGFVGKAN